MGTRAQRDRRKARRGTKQRRLSGVQVDEISLVDNPAVPEATFVIAKRDTTEGGMPEDQVTDGAAANAAEANAGDVAKDGGEGDGGTDAANTPIVKSREAVGAALASAIGTLRSVADQMDSECLHMLASVMDTARWHFGDIEAVQAELEKCDESADEIADKMVEAASHSLVYKAVEGLIGELRKELNPAEAPAEPEPVEKTEEAARGPAPTEQATEPEPVAKTEPGPEPQPEPSMLEKVAARYAERQAKRLAAKEAKANAEAIAKIAALANTTQKMAERIDRLGERLERHTGRA